MLEERHWREECGVVGIAGVQGAAELASMALHALQHRGQESAGITVSDGRLIHTEKAMGLVAEVTFGQLENRRFRHGVSFVRWRPDRTPESCRFDRWTTSSRTGWSSAVACGGRWS